MSIWRVPYPKFGAGPGLERVQTIAEVLGLDIARFGVSDAVVVGSNGKGSTAAMTATLLQQASAPIGLFTSPHLFDLNERFRIDGDDITDAELDYHWRRVSEAAARTGEAEKLGGFEFLFLIAADWFTARRCAHVVWEAGIGGRLDPVRLIQARRLALTSLDLEHTQLLGETLEEIARDKLDAAPAGAKVFVNESCLAQREAIEAHCARRGVTAVFVATPEARGVEELALPGAFQRRNAALAWRLATDMV
jgi:dihydrofolate synthase/folylpolyglutamate synthase